MTKWQYIALVSLCVVLASAAVAAETPEATPSDTAVDVPESSPAPPAVTPPTDSQRAAELARQIQSMISRPPEEMAAMAKKIVDPLLASLRYDRRIAQLETREKRAEEIRVLLMSRAEEKAQSLQSARGELDAAVEEIRRQFGDDPNQAEGDLAAVAQLYRDRLRQLKSEEEECRRRAAMTDAELGETRVQLSTLKRARRAYEQRNRQAEQELVAPTIRVEREPVFYPFWIDEMPVRQKETAAKPTESFDEIMKSLGDL
ncbi:MAG: hypothetical protein A2V98_22610 [Planctomycetes bacterium RBG_16_64_12]|nr:MAG: hypothetical protein A2V98_22610 [Planctomycetes bacterium RBG_16_64_12]